jgi:hypothetical protein
MVYQEGEDLLKDITWTYQARDDGRPGAPPTKTAAAGQICRRPRGGARRTRGRRSVESADAPPAGVRGKEVAAGEEWSREGRGRRRGAGRGEALGEGSSVFEMARGGGFQVFRESGSFFLVPWITYQRTDGSHFFMTWMKHTRNTSRP